MRWGPFWVRSEGMADRRARRGSLQVHLDYAFDRLRESKLVQAYDILVPGESVSLVRE